MKKLLIVGFALVVLIASLLAPTQIVRAGVSCVPVESFVTDSSPVAPGEIWVNSGGITFWRGVTVNFYYTANDNRIQGWSTQELNRNIFPDGTAQGHGTWVLHPDSYPDGYWSGTFTASVDSGGVMRVQMVGKGYGTLNGLNYSGSLEGSPMSTIYGVITELPTYSP